MNIYLTPALTISIWLTSFALQAAPPVSTGHGGAVATISEPASQAALQILDKGGNAIDAAIAAAATLGVTEPFSCGIGGGGFMLIYSARDQQVISIDHRETAPASVTPRLFLEDNHALPWPDAVPNGIAVGVPGTVLGWQTALERYGTLSLAQLLEPAIQVATQGFNINENFHRINQINEAKFAKFESASQLYLTNGKAHQIGSHFSNPDLANTYQLLADRGARAFYEGELADDIVAAVNTPPVKKGITVLAGDMSHTDLKNYEVRLRQPIHSTYRGYDVYGMPAPSSGGIAIAQALNMLETFDLANMERAQVEHLYLQASNLAFADRNAYVADPEYTDIPVQGLLSKEYAKARAQLMTGSALQQSSAGDPFRYQQDPSWPLRPSHPLGQESLHTTHLAVSDREGNVVAYTFTIEDWGGSGIVVPGRGFLLNNELTDFDFSSPHPNVAEAFKRPRSSMSPTIVLKDQQPAFTIGSPGGSTIITTVLQTMVNHIDLGMSFSEAVNAPRMSQRNGDTTLVEKRSDFTDGEQAKALAANGHTFVETEQIGAANGIIFNQDGTVTAVSESKRHGVGTALVQQQ
ncbi:gamma-glutamyltransferase [Oceanisphaera avium]|uniref:Glutathione hydrolase proenzyme n=1 Tax=Oceanisphaera avium TaxID=1903694 RepID=A0A1Y0CW24_9GAMM|nr:gamma-glutamyltransferase [Oceanisphaera avium]ART79408.1 gamma-glutamyltransferase [Oceanisphaera avium]